MTDAPAPETQKTEDTEAASAADAADKIDSEQPAAEGASTDATLAFQTPNKSKSRQRKSISGPQSTGKKLNKKASKARILHLDAQPGDHFYVKLKGFPQWPVIICDEDMLPQSLLKSRPVTAKRADGTYRDDYADGAKKAADRTFPVMYLHTNEFGWVPNTELIDLDPETVMDVKMDKMRKDLQAAHELASQSNPLSFYKDVLQQFQEDLLEQEKAKAAKKAATPKKSKAKAPVDEDEDEDVEMADAAEEEEPQTKEKKQKKRKAEETNETPQRSESVKKPRIKLTVNSTPKTANGASSTPKAAKATAEPKASKTKTKKTKEVEEKKVEKEASVPKDPELSPEEKHARKEKEVLFLRHKLQKGLLTRDQEPREEEMKLMSDYILKLEGFPDLEVSIIRQTKINKVLKAILKLENIPKEDEFQFKSRSQALLEKWNKLLATDAPPAAAEAAPANGVNGTSSKAAASKDETKTNGVKENGTAAEPGKAASEDKEAPAAAEKNVEETKAVEASA
ncbi:hypothetical protein B0T19DRAFT_10915 [Cercophora scortea]|uniref:PWWP domain-containing protein n=1 Tax=Cercophora scortea TaxID=314031 RepID=A0AAE0J2Y2_9PEZI|nr:hypothetical protein B0T19DRAFT_10915 [Cercophora scortea]